MCASPGEATPGPADDHCASSAAQPTDAAACFIDDAGASDPDAGDAGASSEPCAYGDTQFGQEGDDDDCKYHVAWTSTPICEGAGGVIFTVTATNLTDGTAATGIPHGIVTEPFIPSIADAACDDRTTHPGPSTGGLLVETPSGSGIYVGSVVFDAPGDWTLRFHLHEECFDVLPDSPHGHIAFHIAVP
jgi:hypothetical protein